MEHNLAFSTDPVPARQEQDQVCTSPTRRSSPSCTQGDYDGRGQPTASPMLTAIMSGGVGISGRELYKYR